VAVRADFQGGSRHPARVPPPRPRARIARIIRALDDRVPRTRHFYSRHDESGDIYQLQLQSAIWCGGSTRTVRVRDGQELPWKRLTARHSAGADGVAEGPRRDDEDSRRPRWRGSGGMDPTRWNFRRGLPDDGLYVPSIKNIRSNTFNY